MSECRILGDCDNGLVVNDCMRAVIPSQDICDLSFDDFMIFA